jgi:putative ATPase
MAAWQAHKALGSPEGDLALAEAAVYLAVAPKSNAVYQGFNKVAGLIDKGFAHEVPKHLRNAPTKLMKEAGWSKGQKYAHNEPGAITEMTCLPDALVDTRFYEPTEFGLEQRIKIRMQEVRAEIQRRQATKD